MGVLPKLMIKRTVEISTHGCYVHSKHRQLVIEKDKETLGSVPIEDLGVLIIDSPQITLSSGLIAYLAEANVALIFTDAKHLPASVSIPFSGHSTQNKTLQQQVAISAPQRKRLWSQIVSAKIGNQSRSLSLAGKDGNPNRSLLFMVMNIYNTAFERLQMGYASAMSWVFFALVFAVSMLVLKATSRE